jgi:hypothetical protein
LTKKIALLIGVIVCLISIGAALDVANAGTASGVTNVETRTAAGGGGVSAELFNVGDRVYLYWTPTPSGGTVDLIVYGPDGSTLIDVPGLSASDSGTMAASFVVSEPGLYEIDLFGTKYSMNWEIYCGTIFVVPETAIGSLMALLVGFGAIAAFKVVKTKKIILP